MFSSPGPIFIDLGFLTIRWYGFLTALAFITCLTVADFVLKRRKHFEIDSEQMSNFAIAIIIGGLFGARLWFVLLNYEYFLQHPLESFQIWLGGQSIQGGIMGAAITAYLYKLITQKSTKEVMDLLAVVSIVAPLGQAIGRWGNFFNEEAYGAITQLPWALYISHTNAYHHPTFLYESLYNLVVFITLFKLSKKLSNLKIVASYIFLYSLGRILIEPMRMDSLYIGSIKAASLMSFLGLVIALILYFKDSKITSE